MKLDKLAAIPTLWGTRKMIQRGNRIGNFVLLTILVIGLSAFTFAGWQSGQQDSDDDLEFNPRVVINRSFPAIVEPDSIKAADATELVHPEELVLGIELDGVARAYPINMLNGPRREIINDKLGDRLIAATW